MRFLQGQFTHWRATCSYPIKGIDFRDYLRGNFNNFNIVSYAGAARQHKGAGVGTFCERTKRKINQRLGTGYSASLGYRFLLRSYNSRDCSQAPFFRKIARIERLPVRPAVLVSYVPIVKAVYARD